jgi:RNA polymerase sigma-70 factor (ECF subfamily)
VPANLQRGEYPRQRPETQQGVTAMTDPAGVSPTTAALPEALAAQARALWRYLRMHGASATEAEELAQEAFVIALQKGALAAAPSALQAFLQRTARFLFLRLRKAVGRGEQVADAVDELWQRDCAADAGDALIAAARACVEQLEGRARTAIELSYGFGGDGDGSRAAIARELGMQENGVKTLLQRARERLRECIERRRRQ